MPQENPDNSLVLSYLGLRKAVGIIGILLPFVLVFGKILLDGSGIESSISSYYYTIMRDVFVGSLCAIAMFLLSYRGYEHADSVAGKLAAILALGTALFPTSPIYDATDLQMLIGKFPYSFCFVILPDFSFLCACTVSQNKSQQASNSSEEKTKYCLHNLRCRNYSLYRLDHDCRNFT